MWLSNFYNADDVFTTSRGQLTEEDLTTVEPGYCEHDFVQFLQETATHLRDVPSVSYGLLKDDLIEQYQNSDVGRSLPVARMMEQAIEDGYFEHSRASWARTVGAQPPLCLTMASLNF